MANITKGKTFISGETVEPADLHQLVDQATIAFVSADDTDDSTLEASGGKLRVKDAGVTAAKLATGAVTGAAGGGKLAASAITSQTAIDALANDDTLLIHDDSNTALRKVTWAQIVAAAQPVGSVLQTVQTSNATHTTITSAVANDDTAPTSASGTEILSQAITPSATGNKVLVRLSAWAQTSSRYMVAIILRGSTVIQTVSSFGDGTHRDILSCEILDSPSTTSSTTYSVRVGSNTGTIYLNGDSGGRIYGGTSKATLTLQEIKG